MKPLSTLSGHKDRVNDLASSGDGAYLAPSSLDKTIKLWDVCEPQSNSVASRQMVHTLRHGNGLYRVAFSPGGSLVASACCDRTVKLWDVASGLQVGSLPHADGVMAVAFSPVGTLLASGGYDNQIYLWAVPH